MDTLLGLPIKLSPELKSAISNNPTLTLLRHMSPEINNQYNKLPKAKPVRKIKIPDNFKGQEVWDGLITPVSNQGRCGSCWAFASTKTLSDRFNIHSVGLMHVNLSPAKLILCDFKGKEFSIIHPEINQMFLDSIDVENLTIGSCIGNTLTDAWRYLFVIGTNTEKCMPYTKTLGGEFSYSSLTDFKNEEQLPLCTVSSGPIGDMCNDYSMDEFSGDEFGTPARFYRCKDFYSIAGIPKDGGSEFNIRHNIYCWGPVSSGFVVYPDFYTFDPKKEIYEWNGYGDPVGGHAIEIIGWGIDNNSKKPYWWIKNSWGPDWGENGYFRMIRGKNNCKVEENVIAGIPDFFYPDNYFIHKGKSFIYAENPVSVQRRHDIDTDLEITGGGIDPTTGYTRRVLTTKTWINPAPPINIKDLPEWENFYAGINASKPERYKYQKKIMARYPGKKYSNMPIYVTIVIVLIVISIFVIKICK